MTVSSENVVVGKPNIEVSGGVLFAPSGTTAPTDATTALEAAFASVGYISADGLSITEDRSTEQIYAWGGTKVRTVQTEHSLTMTFTLIEGRNEEALKLAFGADNVETTAGGLKVSRNEKVHPHNVIVVEMKDGDRSRRVVAANAQVTEIGDVTYVDGEAIGYELTISCDPVEDGSPVEEYIGAATGE